MTTATAAVSREMLEDRYEGVMLGGTHDGDVWEQDASELWVRLHDTLGEIIQRVSRQTGDGRGFDTIRSELHETIKAEVIRLIDEKGMAE